MVVFQILLFAVFASITVRDVRTRLIHIGDLLLPCAIRIALLVASLTLALDIDAAQWGANALLGSLLLAVALAGTFYLLSKLVFKITNSPALGKGDILLLATCCLFINPQSIGAYLFLVAIFGIALSLVWLITKKDKTFPFAPALVWPCWLVMFIF